MSNECATCPGLRAQVAHWQSLARHHEHRATFLLGLLSGALAAVTGVINFIDREEREPSMPRARLLPTVRMRLIALLEEAKGRLG